MSSLVCWLWILFHVVVPDQTWFIGTNITLYWEAHKIKDERVTVSLCTISPTDNNCTFTIKQNVLNSGKTVLVSSDFDFKSTAKQLQIEQNTTGYFAVSSDALYVTASDTLRILQTVLTSTPIYGGVISETTRTLPTNVFDLMIDKHLFMDYTTITACFVHMDTSTLEWEAIFDFNVRFSTINSTFDTVGDYRIMRGITGIMMGNTSHATIDDGGVYYLWFGLRDSNYYSINMAHQYLIYDASKVSLHLASHTFKPYDAVAMNLSVGHELRDIPIYVALLSHDNILIAECTEHTYDYYHSFGWKWNHGMRIQSGLAYNVSLYWSVIDSTHALHTPLVINITNTKPISPAIEYNKLQFHAASNETVLLSSSFNIGTKLSLQIKQCIVDESHCTWIGDPVHFSYTKKGNAYVIALGSSIQTSVFTKGLTSYFVSTAYLCNNHTMNSTTKIDVLPLFSPYILGDIMHDMEWNPLSIDDMNETIELRLMYWNYGLDDPYQIVSLAMITNNGSLNGFRPKLATMSEHLMINNGAIGVLNLLAHNTNKQLNISSRAYYLFHALVMDHNDACGGVIVNDDAAPTASEYVLRGLLVDSLTDDEMYSFNVHLTDMSQQYSLSNISSIINKTECVPKDYNITYCPFTLRFDNILLHNDTTNTAPNGLYLLSVSRSNYFAINGNKSCQFLVYSHKHLMIEMDAISNTTVDIARYEYKSVSITYDVQMDLMIYATLGNMNRIFVLDCDAHNLTQYTSFGWMLSSIKQGDHDDIVPGVYEFKLYWNTVRSKASIGVDHKYELKPLHPLRINVTNAYSVDIVSVEQLDSMKLYKGKPSTFMVSSTASAGSVVNVYYEQCGVAMADCITYYPNDNGEPYSFYVKEAAVAQQETINIPNNESFKVSSSKDRSKHKTWIVFDIELCDKTDVITTRHNISVYDAHRASHDKNALKSSAVVALICAILLVISLAVLWLFMKNWSGGDGYRYL
eukprot:258841_1